MAYIDYDFYARAYRFEGRALTENELKPLLWDAETFMKGELLATFEKFGIPCVASTPKRLLWEFLGECLRVAPVFAPDGKIIAPRVAYRCADKTFYVSRVPLVRLDLKELNAKRKRKRETSDPPDASPTDRGATKPRRESPRDWEEYRRRNNRRKTAANNENDA
ncbi:MAG: hypothetical protein IJO40_14785 [Thermoguttaceae bacterium]|nr:hypothetical protein [Thermoguttaceae bacterium]